MCALVIEHCVDYMMLIIREKEEKTKLCPDIEVWICFQDSQLNKCKDINKHDNSWINTDLNFFLYDDHHHRLYKEENNFIHSFFIQILIMNSHRVLYLPILLLSLFDLTISATPNCPVEGR